jgi:phosphoribosylglycinamide formyltransferase 1
VKQRIAIFASGTGSNALNMINHFKDHEQIEVSLIVTNNPKAGVCEIAGQSGIPLLILSKEEARDGKFIFDKLNKVGIHYIVLAGYLKKIPEELTKAFHNRIINVHPALLPKFGGHGMFGKHVHQAVFDAKEKCSGITIHYVNEEYDKGAVIFQAECALEPEDSPEDIERKVRQLEQKHFAVEAEKVILHKNK